MSSSESSLASFSRRVWSFSLNRCLVDADLAKKCLWRICCNSSLVGSISGFSKRLPWSAFFFLAIKELADTNLVSRFGSVGMPKLGFEASFSQSQINDIKKRSFVICAAML